MASESPVISTNVGGWTVETNSGQSAEAISANLLPDEQKEEPDPSKAASELGKLGGKASAKARAKAEEAAKKADQLALEAESEPEKPEIEAKEAESEGEAEAEVEAEQEKPEKPLGKPRDDPRARMLEATRKEAEAKRALAAERAERERERQEIAQLRADLEALKRGKPAEEPQAAPKPSGKPNADDFDSYEAYLDARDEWNRKQYQEETEKRQRQSETDRQLDEMFGKFIEATSEIAETIKDTVGQLQSSWQLKPGERETARNWLANELLLAPTDYSPEMARALALHLHEHPDDLQRIVTLKSPRAVTRELTSLVTRLEAATAGTSPEPEKPVSKAPPPIKPVSGASYVAESDGPKPGESFDSWYSRTRKKS